MVASSSSLNPPHTAPSHHAHSLSGTPTPTIHSRQLPTGPEKYRGAVVEDLQLPPAFCLPATALVSRAINEAYERDFSQIPILSEERRVMGYVSVGSLKDGWEKGEINPDVKISNYTTRFPTTSKPYRVITPDTPLEELEEFLKTEEFALITDSERKFVLGVATKADLENFISRRGF
ncbi:hypothetical protein DACRYDRAFT_55907 [Dacryopinax primogenitus]|uniref:CBS domain-containing protein n=1 Tax=Dacryopinax primogenitus (strain DJM 731) TaxID=1858805 RepID=M5G651_DACPD|nr:uncharacterized protein DACRYDRAFT_55907 [Dacryopinax primogenitus]EJT99232.1 hypothetical protein DACRYDRAFT_55907 [Dacryopinax primogenitus]